MDFAQHTCFLINYHCHPNSTSGHGQPHISTQTILYSSNAPHRKQTARKSLTTITKTTKISLCTQSRGSATGEWLEESTFTVLSFDTFPHLHSIERAARRNAQRKKTCQRGQKTEKRKWKGRQGHELWFHLHCPLQFFHRKACVAIKQWGQLLKHALSHWTARQESINSLLLTNRSRTHTQSGAEQAIYKQLPGGNSPPHTLACHPSVNNTGKCLLSYPILHFCELPKTLEKQFNKKLLYYIKLLEFPNLSFPTTDTVQNHREQAARCVKNSYFFQEKK